MAKTTYQEIPAGFDRLYSRALSSGDRYTYPNVRRKVSFISRRRKKGLTQKSLLVQLSPVWQSFTQSARDAWTSAARVCGMTGYRLFVKDTALRISNDIGGYAMPSDLYQANVGLIRIEAPATAAKVVQVHPMQYWNVRKVRGTRNQYEPVEVVEGFALPLQIGIAWRTRLTAAGPSPRVRFFCDVVSNYQGRTISNEVVIEFGMQDDWQSATATLSRVVGIEKGYTAYIEAQDVQGSIMFDNVQMMHSGQNWARDVYCDDVYQAYTGGFYQVAKHWVVDNLPPGAFFGSVYHGMEV